MRGVLQCSGSSLSKHFGRAVEINTKLLYLRVSWGILILHLQVCQMKSCLNSLIFFNCLWNTISAVRIANKASFKTPKILTWYNFHLQDTQLSCYYSEKCCLRLRNSPWIAVSTNRPIHDDWQTRPLVLERRSLSRGCARQSGP